MLGHFALSQDLPLKCWDFSHCPKTTCSSVGTPRTVPRPLTQALGHFALSQDPSSKCWDTSCCPRTSRRSVVTLRTVPLPSFGTLRTVPRPLTQVLGHFALSQDVPLKRWDTSHCPKTTCSSVGTPRTVPRPLTQTLDTSHCPKTPHSSVGTPRTVPRPLTQVLGHHSALSQDLPLKRWDTSHFPRPFVQVLGHIVLSQDLSS